MNKSGIVMDIQKNKVCIMTSSGEFVSVKYKGVKPEIGQLYSTEFVSSVPLYKLPILAASILIMLLFSNIAYAYYSPVATIKVKINPLIELKTNRWDRIIRVTPLNNDGNVLLSSLHLKNRSLNDGLNSILDEAVKKNFINRNYIKSRKEITLSVTDEKNSRKNDFSKFVSYAASKDVKVKVNVKNSNPEGVKNNPNKSLNSHEKVYKNKLKKNHPKKEKSGFKGPRKNEKNSTPHYQNEDHQGSNGNRDKQDYRNEIFDSLTDSKENEHNQRKSKNYINFYENSDKNKSEDQDNDD